MIFENKLIKAQNQNLQYDYLIIAHLGQNLPPRKYPWLAENGYNLYALKEVERLQR